MPAPHSAPPRSPALPPKTDALERLYVYWLVSTVLLVVVVLTIAIVLRGALRQQTAALNELAARVAALEGASSTGPPPPRGKTPPPPPAPTTRPAPRVEPAPERTPEPRPTPPATPPAPSAPPAVEPPAPSDDNLQAQLDAVLSADPVTPADVLRPQAGLDLLELAAKNAGRARWSGPSWSRLAVLARLLGRDNVAKAFADRASAAGDPLTTYAEVTARALLARGRPQEALPLATRVAERQTGATVARVLLVAALLETDDPAAADEVIDTLPSPLPPLDTYDALLLGRSLLALEHWQRLETIVKSIREVPEDLAAEHSFLLAVTLARSGHAVEALAILDGLLPSPETNPARSEPAPYAWPPVGPDRYEIEVWRGATLMFAQQLETARQVLQAAAERNPGRPEAHYYLGLLEARAARPQLAMTHLKNALASSARLAPAWEALALIEIDNGQVNLAIEHLARATAINPRRASAHFLTAIAQAKLSHPDQAADALRRAFVLDPHIVEEAKQTDVVLRLFTPAELDQLATRPASEPASQPADTAATGSSR